MADWLVVSSLVVCVLTLVVAVWDRRDYATRLRIAETIGRFQERAAIVRFLRCKRRTSSGRCQSCAEDCAHEIEGGLHNHVV